jgi:uncharacterized membrane protein
MKLLKLISFLFLIYFIRRFIQAYKVMKQIHETNLKNQAQAQPQSRPAAAPTENVINADYRVID